MFLAWASSLVEVTPAQVRALRSQPFAIALTSPSPRSLRRAGTKPGPERMSSGYRVGDGGRLRGSGGSCCCASKNAFASSAAASSWRLSGWR